MDSYPKVCKEFVVPKDADTTNDAKKKKKRLKRKYLTVHSLDH